MANCCFTSPLVCKYFRALTPHTKYFYFLKAQINHSVLSLNREHSQFIILLDSVAYSHNHTLIFTYYRILFYQKKSPAPIKDWAGPKVKVSKG